MAGSGGTWHTNKKGESFFQAAGETRQQAAIRAAKNRRQR